MLNRRFAIGFVEVFFGNLAPFEPLQQDVGATVRQGLHAHDPSDAERGIDRRIPIVVRLPPFFQKRHGNTLTTHCHIGDHLAIAWFKNVERQIRPGKKDDVG